MMHKAGVYIHIPFCASKCSYCDFLSFSGFEDVYENYVSKLSGDLRKNIPKGVSTVYIGGGTPTVLPMKLLEKVLTCVSEMPLMKDAEISIEANPGTVDMSYLQLLITKGVNRLSFGLQSTSDRILNSIGRIHSFEQFCVNYYQAREVGFKNINVDLMFNLPGQNLDSFSNALDKVLSLRPEHVSFYSLTPCENTPLWNDLKSGKITLACDRLDREMYYLACDKLAENGYIHYEISNAALPGFECVHNLDCWLHEPYIGYGLGAHSFDGKIRWSNPSTFRDYFFGVEPECIVLTEAEILSEAMILGLRLLGGVSEFTFESKYGVTPSVFFDKQIRELTTKGLIRCENNYIQLTARGLDLANQVFMQFL